MPECLAGSCIDSSGRFELTVCLHEGKEGRWRCAHAPHNQNNNKSRVRERDRERKRRFMAASNRAQQQAAEIRIYSKYSHQFLCSVVFRKNIIAVWLSSN